MADGDNVTNSLIKIEVPESIDNAVNNLANKPTETIGQILSDCLYLVFGGLNKKAELKRMEYAFEIKEFAKELENKVESIPDNKRLEPNVHTVCTALDSMRYCVEESQLRNMFSTLIANSINVDMIKYVHPSYGEIIRQLTPFDANVILWMKNQEAIPIIRFRVQEKNKREYLQIANVYLENNFGNLEMLQVSLENLSRLKIIDINLEISYADTELYDGVKQTQKYLEDKAEIDNKLEENKEVQEIYGSIEISQFGKKFIEVCC